MSNKINWNEANTARLVELVAGETPVSLATVASVAAELGGSDRSVSAKLRKLGHEVAKTPGKVSAWTAAQEQSLAELVNSNAGQMTYSELAAVFEDGKFTSKQIQGKLLNMELFHLVKATEKKVTPRTYTAAEEARFISMVQSGATIEDLSAEFDKPSASIRGKALSLLRNKDIAAMPVQKESTAKEASDILAGHDIANMTVAEIAAATDKTERGIKSTLSRRGLSAKDYDGAARRQKLDSKAE
jgi:transposase-like protein